MSGGLVMTALAAAVLAVTAGATAAHAEAASPLAAYKGAARVLVVSAPSAADPALATQDRWLKGQAAGLGARALVVVRIVGDAVTVAGKPGGDAQVWRDAAAVPGRRFTVALIGKDGTQAFAEGQPITTADLFARIDAMPMRRAEMAREAARR